MSVHVDGRLVWSESCDARPGGSPFMNPAVPMTPLPSPDASSRRYTPGWSDGLGDRLLVFDNGTASSLELLRFHEDIGTSADFAGALADRVAALSHLRHPALVTSRSVDRLHDGNSLTLVSPHIAGRRLTEILSNARGAVFALELVRQLTPALSVLQQQGPGIAHGLLSVDRILVTREGRLVIVETPLASAIEVLQWSAEDVRTRLGVVLPDTSAPVSLDPRLDMLHLGVIAVSLVLGRRVPVPDFLARASGLLDECVAIAPEAASKFRPWLERALQMGEHPFECAQDAEAALAQLPTSLESYASDGGTHPIVSFRTPAQSHVAPAPAPAPAVAPPPAATTASNINVPATMIGRVNVPEPSPASAPAMTMEMPPAAAAPMPLPAVSSGPATSPALVEFIAEMPADASSLMTSKAVETTTRQVDDEIDLPEMPLEEMAALFAEPAPPAPPIVTMPPMPAPLSAAASSQPAPRPELPKLEVRKSEPKPKATKRIAFDADRPAPMAAETLANDLPAPLPAPASAIMEPPPPVPSRRRLWLTVAAAGLGIAAVAEAVVIASMMSSAAAPVTGITIAPPAPVESAALVHASMPAPVDDAVVSPAAAEPVAAPVIMQAVVTTPAAPAATSTPGGRFGGVKITAPAELQVFENGAFLGTTSGPIALAEGSHSLDVVNDALGYRAKQTVVVKGGQMATFAITLPQGRLNINAAPWANVWIDGNAAGETPLANVVLPIGTHDILFRHPQLGEQRLSAVVKADGVTRVSASFQR